LKKVELERCKNFSSEFIIFCIKSNFRNSSLSFVRISWCGIIHKLAINWQISLKFNFFQVHLKFAFKI